MTKFKGKSNRGGTKENKNKNKVKKKLNLINFFLLY